MKNSYISGISIETSSETPTCMITTTGPVTPLELHLKDSYIKEV